MSISGGVLITGGNGYLGRAVIRHLLNAPGFDAPLISLDVSPPPANPDARVVYLRGDIRDEKLVDLFRQQQVRCVVHLASIVNPGKQADRAFEHSVDVGGTENVLRACIATGVEQVIVTSSGAAYGYHADNPVPLRETDALRGNVEFAYSDHKRQVEELLARYRAEHPQLRQLVLRPGTILGADTDNQITALFHKRTVPGVAGSDTPFVFIWDEDVAAVIARGIATNAAGIYNLAGDGVMTLREIAALCGGRYLPIPAWALRAGLGLLKALGATHYGPEQVNFLRYRPVLDNAALKAEFGYTPQKTSRETFDYYLAHARVRGQ